MTRFQTLAKYIVILLAFRGAAFAHGDARQNARLVQVELLMDTDPSFGPPPEIVTVSPKLADLWLAALARDEADLKLQAARAFAKARDFGIEPTAEIVAALRRELVAETQRPAVRLQMAQTLVALDARSAAGDLWRQSKSGGLDMQLVVEPALGRWKYSPVYEVWRTRLADPRARRRDLGLAIEGLVAAEDRRSAALLVEIASNRLQASDLRLQAARAAGVLQHAGLEASTRELMADGSQPNLVDRLVAANLIRHHKSEAAQSVLMELATDDEPAVAAIALEQLLAINPVLVTPLNERIATSGDSKVRLLTMAILERQASPAAVNLLGSLLDDVHPGVRGGACQALIRLAEVAVLSETVRAAAMEMLQGEKIRGLEQAALVLGALDHEPAAPRLVALLKHSDPRVSVTVAWALRKLAVRDTAAPILQRIYDETEKSLVLQQQLEELTKQKQPLPDTSHMQPIYDQLAHLIEALGVMGYRESLPELKRFFPKPPMLGITDPPPVATTRQYPLRAAVICALGYMFEGEPRADVVEYAAERLGDDNASHPESSQVRVNSAVALARLGAKDKIPVLERFFQPESGYSTLVDACGWGLEQLTGRAPYEPPPQQVRQFGWFLEPLHE